jgi:hypothetical protein
MMLEMREVDGLARVVVARHGGRVLVLHPPAYSRGDLERLLEPSEVALLRSAC